MTLSTGGPEVFQLLLRLFLKEILPVGRTSSRFFIVHLFCVEIETEEWIYISTWSVADVWLDVSDMEKYIKKAQREWTPNLSFRVVFHLSGSTFHKPIGKMNLYGFKLTSSSNSLTCSKASWTKYLYWQPWGLCIGSKHGLPSHYDWVGRSTQLDAKKHQQHSNLRPWCGTVSWDDQQSTWWQINFIGKLEGKLIFLTRFSFLFCASLLQVPLWNILYHCAQHYSRSRN